jgi:hypothetical protein
VCSGRIIRFLLWQRNIGEVATDEVVTGVWRSYFARKLGMVFAAFDEDSSWCLIEWDVGGIYALPSQKSRRNDKREWK